ncbi:hypothetical protein BV25DRAFT_1830872 [Artomyces pyxidatus]|uniref:Uncharacterized protein n=1 Tax=Artomyces pyxidatus TaxID=48021 RepID=A0ACB8SP05_9AGAM|nr:hypothetical protein BV25DRAFT_1830872 [Artomyces pyxidatus]
MSGYSSIFASGLLATPHRHPGSTPSRSSSPDMMALDTTPTNSKSPYLLPTPGDDDVDYFSSPRSRASSTTSTASSVQAGAPPRLRRRRSSLTVATTAMGAIKSPLRSASVALQRSGLMTPGGRARSGSVDVVMGMEDFGSTPNPITGRMRSGSLGGALRTRRTIRKPATAPPTMPLPPPPSSAPSHEVSFRRPLMHRSHTSDNYASFAAALGSGANTYLTPDFANKLLAAMNTPPLAEGELAKEN